MLQVGRRNAAENSEGLPEQREIVGHELITRWHNPLFRWSSGRCPRTWWRLGVAPCFPASDWAGPVPGTAESMMMGLSLSGAMVSSFMCRHHDKCPMS